MALEGRLDFVRSLLNLPILIFFLSSIISLTLSPYKRLGLSHLYQLTTYLLLYLAIINNIKERKDLSRVINLWLLGAGLASLYVIYQHFLKGKGRLEYGFCTFGNPNFLASYLVISFPLAINGLLHNLQSSKLARLKISLSALLIILISLAFVAALSRGGSISLVVAILFMVILYPLVRRPIILGIGIVALLTVGLLLLPLLSFPEEGGLIDRGSVGIRVRIWQGTLRMIKASPLLGWGIGSYSTAYQIYKVPEFFKNPDAPDLVEHAHSEYLEVASEMGLIGLGIYLWIIINLFRKGISMVRRMGDRYLRGLSIAILAGTLGMLFHNLFDVNLRFPSSGIFLWLSFGLTMSIHTIYHPSHIRINVNGIGRALFVALAVLVAILGAIFVFPEVVKRPFLAEVHFKRGLDLRRKGDPDIVISEYKEALRLNPWRDEIPRFLAIAYKEKGDLRGAISFYKKELEIHPNFPFIYNHLARLYIRVGEGEEALNVFDRSIEANPYDPKSYSLRGELLYKMGRKKEAYNDFKKAIEVDPNFPDAYNCLGNIYRHQGDLEGAIFLYQIALSLAPKNIEFRLNLANTYIDKGEVDKAVAQLEEILNLQPENEDACRILDSLEE